MNILEIKKTLSDYAALEKRAEEVLKAGNISFGGINSVWIECDIVGIGYWGSCRGEICNDYAQVPVEMLADGADLEAEWDKIHEEQEQKRKKAEAAAKRAVKRAEKAEAKKKVKAYLEEIDRLKKQYPEMFKAI